MRTIRMQSLAQSSLSHFTGLEIWKLFRAVFSDGNVTPLCVLSDVSADVNDRGT